MSDSAACTWTEEPGEGGYVTACTHHFYFDSGDVFENGFQFCPYCSKPIEPVGREGTST
jgi:hypothetical protein